MSDVRIPACSVRAVTPIMNPRGHTVIVDLQMTPRQRLMAVAELLSNGMSNYYTGGILQGASVQAYDLARGQYAALQMLIEPRCFIRYGLPQQPDTEMAPARMGSRGIR